MVESRLDNFTHLQVHSHYTLLGGTAAIPDLAARAAGQGMNALALTDTAVLYGAVQFTQACQQRGIQPIIGLTVPLAAEGFVVDTAVPGQIVLLATNPAGYRALNRISSAIQTDPAQNYRQRGIPWELLRQNRGGLMALDGGRRGWLARLLCRGDEKTAVQYAARLAGLFDENGYLALEIHRGGAEDAEVFSPEISSAPSASPQLNDITIAQQTIAIGQRFGLAAVAVQPVYCLEPVDAPKLRLLAAIDRNCRLEDVPDSALPDEGDTAVTLHWQSPDQIAAAFRQFPDAVARVGEIVACCGDVLPDGRPIWPALDLPPEQTPAQALAAQAEEGLAARYGDAPHPAIRQRLAHELALINQFGFAPLFLLVADITRFARASGVPVNTRGSVANSLVAYYVGITTVDPIAHDLLFERFLNPARASLPDIDLDFCSRRRDEVLHYVRQKYGAERVALVSAMSTMRLKSAMRETAKAYGLDEAAIRRLASLIPRRWHPDPRRRQTFELEEALAQLDDAREREALRAAVGIAGQPHHLTVHPGGIVITPGPLTDVVPLQITPKGFTVTQYDHRDVEAIGLPKIDLLGIRALTVLADAADLIRQRRDPDFDLEAIPPNDAATAVILQSGQTIGVFQCESTGAQRTLRQLRAKNVADLAIANAFFKPGPALGGMAQAFVRRYRGEESVTFLHPLLEPILGRTKGVLIFQEQVLRIATEIAGLNWTEANAIRRGMSKFQKGDLLALRQRFVAGCQEKAGLTAVQAEQLWGQVAPFAGYGFNQGHATAYAAVSYRSAWLKAHYPAEFFCARLADHGGFHHPAIYVAEAQRLGITVRPPHVNFSGYVFTLEIGDRRLALDGESLISNFQSPILYMGLGQIRDLRHSAVAAIVAERPYTSLRDLLQRVSLQKKEITHLIQCGALDGLGESRAALLAEAVEIERAGSAGQLAFGFVGGDTAVSPESLSQRLEWESCILGWPVSANPVAAVRDETAHDMLLRDVPVTRGQSITIAGTRLPGWTGGPGFFFGDGDSFLIVQPGRNFKEKLVPWEVVRLYGRWREDEWGGGWFEMERVGIIAADDGRENDPHDVP